MKSKYVWIALALFAAALVLIAIAPRSGDDGGGVVHLATATPSPTTTPGWWGDLPTPEPLPTEERSDASNG